MPSPQCTSTRPPAASAPSMKAWDLSRVRGATGGGLVLGEDSDQILVIRVSDLEEEVVQLLREPRGEVGSASASDPAPSRAGATFRASLRCTARA